MLGKTIKSTKSHYCHQNYAKSWSNNGLLMRNVVAANKCLAEIIFCVCVNETTLFLLLATALV